MWLYNTPKFWKKECNTHYATNWTLHLNVLQSQKKVYYQCFSDSTAELELWRLQHYNTIDVRVSASICTCCCLKDPTLHSLTGNWPSSTENVLLHVTVKYVFGRWRLVMPKRYPSGLLHRIKSQIFYDVSEELAAPVFRVGYLGSGACWSEWEEEMGRQTYDRHGVKKPENTPFVRDSRPKSSDGE